jgi:hypothetical protein
LRKPFERSKTLEAVVEKPFERSKTLEAVAD